MANQVDCILDVLATSPKEITDTARALQEPSKESLVWLWAAIEKRPPDAAEIEQLRELVAFQAAENLDYVAEDVSKTRRLINFSTLTCDGMVERHLRQVSTSFPCAIFLLDYRDMQMGWSSREVMRNGVIERSVWDGDQPAQAFDWMLLDIFAPFRAEYELGLPFGSLWNEWVDDLVDAAAELRNSPHRVGDNKNAKHLIESLDRRAIEKWGSPES